MLLCFLVVVGVAALSLQAVGAAEEPPWLAIWLEKV